jgi:hypothetical protein
MKEEKKSQLTITKGVLAIVAMYVCQLLAGIITSYTFKLFAPSKAVPIEIIGVSSALLSGIMILLLFWWDLKRSGKLLYPQIGLQASKIKNSRAVLLVIAALVSTHFLAWIYRSVILT